MACPGTNSHFEVSEKFGDYGSAVLKKLQSSGLRASLDNRSEKIGAKIREERLDLVPYLAVVVVS